MRSVIPSRESSLAARCSGVWPDSVLCAVSAPASSNILRAVALRTRIEVLKGVHSLGWAVLT
ncbi:uncharacterized protein BDV14DRAFT_162585 [Aspergillus stella-maris]|uniref:uncharacterized protein n=1 Tax=Aspergillus stella-maris TaxID=1810926 RepID=UPI003CCCC518